MPIELKGHKSDRKKNKGKIIQNTVILLTTLDKLGKNGKFKGW